MVQNRLSKAATAAYLDRLIEKVNCTSVVDLLELILDDLQKSLARSVLKNSNHQIRAFLKNLIGHGFYK